MLILTHLRKKLRKTLWEKVKLLILSNFTFFHNLFFVICIVKSLMATFQLSSAASLNLGQSHKWCIVEWVDTINFLKKGKKKTTHDEECSFVRYKFRISEKFRYMSDLAGWHGSILFANAYKALFLSSIMITYLTETNSKIVGFASKNTTDGPRR